MTAIALVHHVVVTSCKSSPDWFVPLQCPTCTDLQLVLSGDN